MGLMQRIQSWLAPERAAPLSFNDWVSYFQFGANGYGFLNVQQTLQGRREEITDTSFSGLVEQAYKANGVVFACMLVRLLLFSEARFQFRRIRNGRPGELFGTDALLLLERPWPNGTTGDLLARAIQDADLSGNCFIVRRPGRLKRLRPDWVTIVLGAESDGVTVNDVDAEVIGYMYHPGGRGSGSTPMTFGPSEVAHFAPIPDPTARFRGMSWLTPVLRELAGDLAASAHKIRYFENGATPNLVVSLDADIDLQQFRQWIELFKQDHEGVANAYKTLFLGAGAKAEAVGSNLQQIDFKAVQGAGETRIAAAAGVPPVIVGLSEGLQAATYSNYGQARRRLADGTMRPLWRNLSGSLATVVDVPGGAELWYDDRDISFLQEDVKDSADIQSVQAQAIKALVDSGFDADSVVIAVTSGDLSLLSHTGLFSVQLQPPGADQQVELPAARAVRAVEELIASRTGAAP
jgi:phage portal protein BeeE